MGTCVSIIKSSKPSYNAETNEITLQLPGIITGSDRDAGELNIDGNGEMDNNGEMVNNGGEMVNNGGEMVNNGGEMVNNGGEMVNVKPTKRLVPLHELVPASISNVPYKNKLVNVYVCDVYDGDTCTILYYMGDTPVKTNLRILGIDAPEVNTRMKNKTELQLLEEQAGAKVKDIVKELIFQQYVDVKFIKHDKYGGRILADIIISVGGENMNISDYLLDNKYAKKYAGLKKEAWSEEDLRYILDN